MLKQQVELHGLSTVGIRPCCRICFCSNMLMIDDLDNTGVDVGGGDKDVSDGN